MTAIALAQFFTVQNESGTVLQRWQNYWPNTTVDSHTFLPFDAGAILSQISPGSDSLSIIFPVSQQIHALMTTGFELNYIGRLDLYQFVPPVDNSVPEIKDLIASYTGKFIQGTVGLTQIELRLGIGLDPTEAQVPPRKFTTSLVGKPPKL